MQLLESQPKSQLEIKNSQKKETFSGNLRTGTEKFSSTSHDLLKYWKIKVTHILPIIPITRNHSLLPHRLRCISFIAD